MGRRKQRDQAGKTSARPDRQRKHRWVSLHRLSIGISAAVLILLSWAFFSNPRPATSSDASVSKPVRKAQTLDQLLAMTPEQLAEVDVAEMNLLCATGLPGSEEITAIR